MDRYFKKENSDPQCVVTSLETNPFFRLTSLGRHPTFWKSDLTGIQTIVISWLTQNATRKLLE